MMMIAPLNHGDSLNTGEQRNFGIFNEIYSMTIITMNKETAHLSPGFVM